MSDTPETIADIAAEIRRGERMFWSLRDCAAYADRIEAAAERERDEDRQLAAIAESDEAFARCARCDRPTRRNEATMPSPKIKPCPFCGGQARAYLKISLSADEPEKPLIEARVQCLGCTAEVFGIASIGTPLSPFAVADTSGNEAILRAVAAWNRRAGEERK